MLVVETDANPKILLYTLSDPNRAVLSGSEACRWQERRVWRLVCAQVLVVEPASEGLAASEIRVGLQQIRYSIVTLGQDIETDICRMDGSKLTGKITRPASYNMPDANST